MARWIPRAALIVLSIMLGILFRPFGYVFPGIAGAFVGAAIGLAFALAALGVEAWLRAGSLWSALGAAGGVVVGGLAASTLSRLLPSDARPAWLFSLLPFVKLAALYLGAVSGARLAAAFEDVGRFDGSRRGPGPGPSGYKIVDTSVIIDGRIVGVCEAHFLDGVLVVPSFVLRELQYVADAADPLRRARGRRGLETLQALKKCPAVKLLFIEDEIPEIREVDLKLLELARRMGAKLVTQDYNLHKVASIRGIEVLNLNELARGLKPVVLPGEALRVAILREGKEAHQGVAYLDDGTMVVVEQARGMVGKTVDVVIASALQTTAGTMFFAKVVEAEAAPAVLRADSTEPV